MNLVNDISTAFSFLDMINIVGFVISILFIMIFVFFGRIEYKARIVVISGFILLAISFFYDFLASHRIDRFALIIFPFAFISYFMYHPMIYHYILNFFNDRKTLLIERNKFLFVPVIIILLLIFYVPSPFPLKRDFIHPPVPFSFNNIGSYTLFSGITFLLYYIQLTWFLLLLIRLYKINKEHYLDNFQRYVPKWLFSIFIGTLVYEMVYGLVILVSNIAPAATNVMLQSFSLAFAIFIGFIGLKHDDIVILVKMEKIRKDYDYHTNQVKSENTLADMDEDTRQKTAALIESLILNHELYKNPGLKLEHLVRRLHISRQQLSAFINSYYGVNFTQFINQYRIEYAKSVLKEQAEVASIEKLLPDFGFYSRSTFNRVFKTLTGVSPSDYRKQHSPD